MASTLIRPLVRPLATVGLVRPLTQSKGVGGAIILLSNSSVLENEPAGTVIGTLSVIFGTGLYAFSVSSDPSGLFAVDGDDLVTADELDYETVTTYGLTVHADNGLDPVVSQVFFIDVLDVFEPPPPGGAATYYWLGF